MNTKLLFAIIALLALALSVIVFTPASASSKRSLLLDIETATETATPSEIPVETATPTETITEIITETETATVTETPTETVTPTEQTPTETVTLTETVISTETSTETVTPTETPTETETATPTVSVTITRTITPTITKTRTNTVTITKTRTNTRTLTRTTTRTPTKTQDPNIKTAAFSSNAAQDGWILESSETSGRGGTMNSSAATLNLGDSATKKQYVAILSFNTSSLPDTAKITSVTLKIKSQSIIGGGNPVSIFQGFMWDISNSYFGTSTALEIFDFQAAASNVYGPTTASFINNIYSLNLTPGKAFINKLTADGGMTQIRLAFQLDDNNNAVANILSLYSGNAIIAADRPQLVIVYALK